MARCERHPELLADLHMVQARRRVRGFHSGLAVLTAGRMPPCLRLEPNRGRWLRAGPFWPKSRPPQLINGLQPVGDGVPTRDALGRHKSQSNPSRHPTHFHRLNGKNRSQRNTASVGPACAPETYRRLPIGRRPLRSYIFSSCLSFSLNSAFSGSSSSARS